MSAVRTTCPYCGVGCGIVATNGVPAGDVAHPANAGKLCSKGAALKDTLALPDRLLSPTIDGKNADWDSALSLIAQRFGDAIREHGPDSVAFYVSGQFLTEDYYVANKLMKGFIGSANIDTNSRLCMASSVAGHIRAFGEDIVPGCYDDIEECDLAVLTGSNMAWCHPVLYRRLMTARDERGTKIVVIDPRRTAACESADLHLALAQGSDIALFNGLLTYLHETGACDRGWIDRHVSGFSDALAAANADAPSLAAVAKATGIASGDLLRFYELFAETERAVTFYSQGVNQSAKGTDKVNAILNCHLATARIGRPGMGPFSLTGQPNAMGGREVGGLANQLAAHMGFAPDDVDRVRRFWNAPAIATKAGLKAVDMFKAVAEGRIKAIWIAATNPAATMPGAGAVRGALARCPFVVVSDAWPTGTTALANVVLPAAAWAEKDGTVTNSERCISRQRAFRAPPGYARPDWWMFAELGRRLGFTQAFAYSSPAEIFREHAALSAFENDGSRIFDIGAFAECTSAQYDAMTPAYWPQPRQSDGATQRRLFADGTFPTPDGRAHMIPVASGPERRRNEFTLILNTGRIRDQWHTMTRTGRVPGLMTHAAEPELAIHPNDAARCGVASGDLVRIENAQGAAVARTMVTDTQRPGEVFAAMHWTDQFSSSGAIGRLVHAMADPISGQPDLKGSEVHLAPIKPSWAGVLLRRTGDVPQMPDTVHWSKAPIEQGFAFELDGWSPLQAVIHSEEVLRQLLQIPAAAELITYSDTRKGSFRYAGFIGGRLEACLYLAARKSDLPPKSVAMEQLGRPLDAVQRIALLAACGTKTPDASDRTVCACFSIGSNRIAAAIEHQNLSSVNEIGRALQAGTNCGSCIPELTRMLREALPARQ